jgi:subtilase family serine protease
MRREGSLVVCLLAVLASLYMVVVSPAQAQTLLTRHVREVVLNGEAQSLGRLPTAQSIRLVLVLPHRNQAELESLLKDLYDPHSAAYRRFLTVEEFTATYGPSQEDYDSVIRFAEANGFTVVGTSRNRMNLEVTGSVETIAKAFHLTLGVYQHPTENRTFFAPDREPTVDLPFQLWHITGLDNYSTPKPAFVRRDANVRTVKSNATTGSGPDDSFLGSDMRAAYYGKTALTGSGQSLGLFEFLGTDLADLTTYYSNIGQTNNVPITLKSVDTQSTSCKEPNCDDTEQTLDMTQALGMAPGLSGLVMYIGTGGLSGQTLDDSGIFNAMATAKPLNAQLSCSWAWKPSDPTTDDVYFEEFAAQGQNLFLAAGDDGSWADAEFVWPADSVYVTSVGGTDLETTGAAGPWASETGWAVGGGGISPDDFAIPSWQVAAAAGCAECSQTYRNGPDVAANADFTFYVCADQDACTANEYGGTSFAAPMWAGYLALANEQHLLNGSTTTLGFINPALYTIGGGSNYDTDFHDCLTGGNTYGCTVGYDLSTGWGSPKGSALIDALAGNASGPAVTLTPASLAFGDVIEGETSAGKKVTLKDTGGSTLNISKIAASGDFALKTSTKPCGSTLAAGVSCIIEVTFTPEQLGALTGDITITDNASNSPQTVSLSGTGEPQATLTPATATYAKQTVGTTSAAKVFTLTNKQSVALTSIVISTTGDFSVSTTTCTTSLAAKTSCKISVVFKPTGTGTLKGILKVADSAVGSPQTSSLTGTGKAAAK